MYIYIEREIDSCRPQCRLSLPSDFAMCGAVGVAGYWVADKTGWGKGLSQTVAAVAGLLVPTKFRANFCRKLVFTIQFP